MNLYSCNLIARSDMASIVDSLVAPLSVINALVVALSMRKQKTVVATLEALEKIWDEYQVYNNDEINLADNHEIGLTDSIHQKLRIKGVFYGKILIIGGGAAVWQQQFFWVRKITSTSFEKNEKLGKKLFITGKGRCNIIIPVMMKHFKSVVTNSNFYTALFMGIAIKMWFLFLKVWDWR